MKLTITKRYLTLPINDDLPSKRVTLCKNGTLLYDLDCRIDACAPDGIAFIDVSRFLGQTLDIAVTPETVCEIGEVDAMELPELYHERLRPQIHFSVKNGWNNDPNGLVYHDGRYHLFYQYNPCGTKWGNMHWGHATSRDLLHWQEQEIALYPDEMGMMYSGSGILDAENRTGLGKDGKGPLLFYYTAAGNQTLLSQGAPRVQCLAYSNDGGKTLEKYAQNPILGVASPGNHDRDPKVVWVEELQKYVMALYIDEDYYHLFTSENLLDWSFLQKVMIKGDWECPDLYCLSCEGERKWVLSGARDLYLVGHFTNREFVIEQEARPLTYGSIGYAAQSYTGNTDGRVLRITWDRVKIPSPRVTQQMGLPTEMRLVREGGVYYLCSAPARELETLRARRFGGENIAVFDTVRYDTGFSPLDITLTMPYQKGETLTLLVLGHEVRLDMASNRLRTEKLSMPLSADGRTVTLRLVSDRCTLDIYADGGKFCSTRTAFADPNLPYVALTASGTLTLDSFACYTLDSIYE